ncbi:PLXNB [Mytilus edulis]|uniref:PLXNB n=1 Tax=Mytilus edulis TaxID=6550 RepID=A0A8S3R3K1_MYTED|nr:PLXNB [Mytilus edulis]
MNWCHIWKDCVFENETLIVCNYISEETHDSRCRNYKVEHGIDSFNSDQGSIRINHQSTRYLTTSVQNKNVLLIASSTCIRTDTLDTTCYAILSLEVNSLQKFNTQNLGFEYNVVHEGTNTGHVKFKTAFKVKEFVYFLFNTEDRHSKIGKMCTSSEEIKSNSYEDTPIACSYNNNNYTLAEDAVFWKEYLYVAFTGDSSSVICRYNLIAIEKNLWNPDKTG